MRNYGWRPDLPDVRDFTYLAPEHVLGERPQLVELHKNQAEPAIWNQGNLGSCTAHGNGHVWCYTRAKQGLPFIMPSRLKIYYDERVIENTVRADAGAQIRDGIKVLAKQGACAEKLWPYEIAKFWRKPPLKSYREAVKHEATAYARVPQTIDALQQCLFEGYPVVFGFTVYESFETPTVAQTGIVPMPSKTEHTIGGHCVSLVGYDTPNQQWICRNSWGTGWGQNGYFRMPFEYLLNPDLAADFWTVRMSK